MDGRHGDVDWKHVIEGSIQHKPSYSIILETYKNHPHLVSTINTSFIVFIVYIFLSITHKLIHLLYKFVMRKTILVLWIQPQALTNLPINVKFYFINSQLVDKHYIIQTQLNNEMSHFFHALLVVSVGGMPTGIFIVIWKKYGLQNVLKVVKIHKMAQHHTLLSVQMPYLQDQTESGKELLKTPCLT
jgi:hypothetical protein